MSDPTSASDRRALLASAVRNLEQMQARLDAAERAQKEPVAIVGMGCRFPGADTPDRFWSLLRDGVDAVREIPADRWNIDEYYDPDPTKPGKMYVRRGGFLDQVDLFDTQFFGISPREAESLDPQQRLMLEVSWEALEHAGIAPASLRGSRTGVFVGIGSNDYAQAQLGGGLDAIDVYTGSGGGVCFSAGRVSYCLGLQGPSIAVDTACSSSLVAVHLACQAVRAEECRVAIVGGVNVMTRPELFVYLSRVKALAADGRCKAFDAAADGFVRGEGCGIIIVKRLSDAIADGDRVLAIIRGSAVNQDGSSSGITVPNGRAQQAIVADALSRAGVAPVDVSYIEAHGTGTSLGDPIEAGALAATFGGRGGSNGPLVLGSVKTNIGHLEAAAGIAGVIKTVLALHHRAIPPHLHFKTLNPAIDFGGLPVVIPTALTPWPDKPRLVAGVSAFGLSGTNAHVVLEAAPAPVQKGEPPKRPLHVLTLSARTDGALRESAAAFADHLAANPSLEAADVCATAAIGRSHFSHRVAVTGASTDELRSRLSAFVSGQASPGVISGNADSSRPPKVAFLFTGQGSQYRGMGRELFETQPVFRRALERCSALLEGHLEYPLLALLYDELVPADVLDQTANAQPALFAIEYALSEMWRSWGVEPSAVLGHSIGEFAAACTSGVLNVEDAVQLVAARGRLMQELPERGAMAAVYTDEARAAAALAGHADRVSIAAVNGPTSVVVSGATDGVEAVCAALAADGIRSEPLRVSHAFHSPLMSPMLDAFERVATSVRPAPSRIGLVSNVTGTWARDGELDASYWRRHVASPVRFAASMKGLWDQGYRVFVEIGPTPTLTGMAKRFMTGSDARWIGSLSQGRGDWASLLDALAALYVSGARIDWSGFDSEYPRRRVTLPTYPFQRQRYWLAPADPHRTVERSPFPSAGGHPLLGEPLRSPALREHVFESQVGVATLPYLEDQKVFGTVVFPAAAYLELALAGAARLFASDKAGNGAAAAPSYQLEDVVIGQPLTVTGNDARVLQLTMAPLQDGATTFRIFSAAPGRADADGWTLHASGRLVAGTDTASSAPQLDDARRRCTVRMAIDSYYTRLHECGVTFGPAFRQIQELWQGDGEAIGSVTLADVLAADASSYVIHPALLDASLQVLGAALMSREEGTRVTYLPIAVQRFTLSRTPPVGRLWSCAKLRGSERGLADTMTADITLADESGVTVAELRGLVVKRATSDMLPAESVPPEWLYQAGWQPVSRAAVLDRRRTSQISAIEIAATVTPLIPALRERFDIAAYRDLPLELDVLARAHVVRALSELGWQITPGEMIRADSLTERLRIVDRHRLLLARMLAMLEEQGVMRTEADGWRVVQTPADVDTADLVSRLLDRFPACRVEIGLIERCGRELANVMRGAVDPLHLLFPDGSLKDTEHLYQDSPFARLYNATVSETVRAAIAPLSSDRPVRVLEIGGGTGGTTQSVIEAIPPGRVQYTFTDVSPLFLAQARDKFARHAFMDFRLLDIEREPCGQGLPEGGFDVIVAANVLHATRDLRETMTHVRTLAAPGAIVVLLEGTKPQDWVDVTFGLTPGWWKFTDRERRPAYPLIRPSAWRMLLEEMGFSTVGTIPGDDTADDLSGHSVIVAQSPGSSSKRWLLFADQGGIAHGVAERLRRDGARVALAVPDTAAQGQRAKLAVDPRRLEDFRRVLREAFDGEMPHGVVDLWPLDIRTPPGNGMSPIDSMQERVAMAGLHLVQALAGTNAATPPRLWLVTRGAQPVAGALDPAAIHQASLWGFGKVVALEHPELRPVRVDLDPSVDARLADDLIDALQTSDREEEVGYRRGVRHVARLLPATSGAPTGAGSIALRPDRTYLVTGGLAGLGLAVAGWMVDHGARHLVLVGRSAPAPAAARALGEMERAGAHVRVMRADVSRRNDVEMVLHTIDRDGPPLAGIVHSAGVLDDGVLAQQTWDRFARVLQPKVAGAWNLHTLTAGRQLDYFVLFSSAAALLGSAGQANHAAANAFLDALAHSRRAQGLAGISINWGAWSEVGAAATRGVDARTAAFGMGSISVREGLRAFEFVLRHNPKQVGVLPVIDWQAVLRSYAGGSQPPFVTAMVQTPSVGNARVSVPASTLDLTTLRSLSVADRERTVMRYLGDAFAKVLRLKVSDIDRSRPITDFGFDSLMAVELKNRLERDAHVTVPIARLLAGPSIAELSTLFLAELTTDASAGPPELTTAAALVVVGGTPMDRMEEGEV